MYAFGDILFRTKYPHTLELLDSTSHCAEWRLTRKAYPDLVVIYLGMTVNMLSLNRRSTGVRGGDPCYHVGA